MYGSETGKITDAYEKTDFFFFVESNQASRARLPSLVLRKLYSINLSLYIVSD